MLATHIGSGGFTGSPAMPGEKANLAMTYTALLNLAILRDDFSQLNKEGVRALLRATQQSDGRYVSTLRMCKSLISIVLTSLYSWSRVAASHHVPAPLNGIHVSSTAPSPSAL